MQKARLFGIVTLAMGDGRPRLDALPRTAAAIRFGIGERLHLGAQLYVSLDGETRVDAALGEDRPGVPLTADHRMLWLSATKPVTAVAVAQLWERGLLALDDPIARHLPAFGQGGKESVTIRHVLTHTGGFRMLDVGWPEMSWDQILERIYQRRLEPRWVPGRKAGYHMAASWFVLGELIRHLDGRPPGSYLREEVLVPLGMKDCWVGMPEEAFEKARREGLVAQTWKTGDWAVDAAEPPPHAWSEGPRMTRTHPGGNGRGPMRELGRFYEALLAGGAPLLAPQTVEAITARHRTGMVDQTFKHVLDWGLGFILDSKLYGADTVPYGYGPHASYRTFGHGGYRSVVAFADPEVRLVVALAFNGTPSKEDHDRRIHAVLGALYEDLGLASPQRAEAA